MLRWWLETCYIQLWCFKFWRMCRQARYREWCCFHQAIVTRLGIHTPWLGIFIKFHIYSRSWKPQYWLHGIFIKFYIYSRSWKRQYWLHFYCCSQNSVLTKGSWYMISWKHHAIYLHLNIFISLMLSNKYWIYKNIYLHKSTSNLWSVTSYQ